VIGKTKDVERESGFWTQTTRDHGLALESTDYFNKAQIPIISRIKTYKGDRNKILSYIQSQIHKEDDGRQSSRHLVPRD